MAPGLTAAPARLFQEVGGRSQRIGHAVHQVTPTVAVKVDRQPHVGRGHELGMAESARPGSGQAFGRDMVVLDDLQHGKEFTAEEVLATAMTGQRGQRAQQRTAAEIAPEVALHPPHGHHRGAIDAIFPLDPVQHRGPLRQHRTAVRHPLLIDQRGEVIPDRGDELRLGIEKSDHGHVRHQRRGMTIEQGGRHAPGRRLGPQTGETSCESGVDGVGGSSEAGSAGQRRALQQEQFRFHGPAFYVQKGRSPQTSP